MQTYIARNTRNGKFYIGSTKNFNVRKKAHLGNQGNFPFHRDLRKNHNDFEWEVFEDDSEERELEQALLDMFFGKKMCYNLCPFAVGGAWTATGHCWVNDGSTERYVETGTEVEDGWMLGRLPVAGETKEKMRKAQTGKVRPECASAVGRVWVTTPDRTEEIYLKPGEEAPKGWVKGRKKFAPRTSESRSKTSRSLKGRKKTNEHKENLRAAALRQHHG
jgi:hypothetical protein